MCRAKQHLAERLHHAGVLLDLGSKHVSEDIPTRRVGIVVIIVKLVLKSASLGVSHEVGLDAKVIAKVDVELSAAAKDVETGNRREVGVNVHKGKSNRDFYLRNILRRCAYSRHQQACTQ